MQRSYETDEEKKMANPFSMPSPVKITGRATSITNSFVNSIIPVVYPSKDEVHEALAILSIDPSDVRCAYCDDPSTEWDHLRPLVLDKRPTGYISEIANLVPACGKCNQSKGNKPWEKWIISSAPLSPKSRSIPNLSEKIERLKVYEKWGNVEPFDFEFVIGEENWTQHWNNWQLVLNEMKKSQELATELREQIKHWHDYRKV